MATDDTPRAARPRSRFLHIALILVALAGVGVSLFPPAVLTSACPRAVKRGLTWARRLVPAALGGGERQFTLDELRTYDGTDGKPIYLAFGGIVYDVTEKGKQYYGPGMAYAVFAGRDGTRALSLGSLDVKDLDRRDVGDFDAQKRKLMQEQHEFYAGKYPRVGTLED